MHNDISTEERIDNYLLGRMSLAEKALFEAELESDPDLRTEYECQKAIADAVQKVAMKDFLEEHAARRKALEYQPAASVQEQGSHTIDLSDVLKSSVEKIRSFFGTGQRLMWTIASVAAMVVAIVGSVNYSSTLHSLQNNGALAYAELAVPVARGGEEVDSIIEHAYVLLGTSELDQALDAIRNAKEMVLENMTQPVVSEEDNYKHLLLQQRMYDLEWYEAIAFMKQGKVSKSKKALKAIASSASPYAESANNALKNHLKSK